MAAQKITYECASGCGTTREVEIQPGQRAQAPVCCGLPMKQVAQK